MQEKTLSELLEAYESALKNYGLGYSSRLYAMREVMSLILRHMKVGEKYLDEQIISDFIGNISERFYNGEIGKNRARNIRREIERFVRFVQTGEVHLESALKGSKITLLPEFQCIADKFLASEDFHPNTRNDMRWVVYKTIDRRTATGKRAYAVMLLGTVLGLRACDIINLKRADIDWVNGELRILQSKTGRTVVLPLTKDVGEALEDYILNARPDSNAPQIFLRLSGAFAPLKCAVTIGDIYRNCCIAAGLPVSKKFHTLRRSLGTSMLGSGSPVTMVAQVLGQSDADSTKKYIAGDYEHMKMCALSFDEIMPMAAEIGGAR